MPRTRSRRSELKWIVGALALGAAAAAAGVSDGLEQNIGSDARRVAEGRQLFTTHCASCHGTSGAGGGPAATAMRKMPPDITGLAVANGGTLPVERLRRIIDGRQVEAHGDREMPVWGDAFKSAGGRSDESIRQRIDAILEYLASIQKQQA